LIFSFKEADCLCRLINTQSPWEEQKNKNPAWFYRRMFRRGFTSVWEKGWFVGEGFFNQSRF
jgi:hypothetical protein